MWRRNHLGCAKSTFQVRGVAGVKTPLLEKPGCLNGLLLPHLIQVNIGLSLQLPQKIPLSLAVSEKDQPGVCH